jgi:hypothetical protein
MPPDDRVVLPCDCAGTCSILIAVIEITDRDVWFEICEAFDWGRAKAEVLLLLGRENTIRGVCLDQPRARELRDFLDQHLERTA